MSSTAVELADAWRTYHRAPDEEERAAASERFRAIVRAAGHQTASVVDIDAAAGRVITVIWGVDLQNLM